MATDRDTTATALPTGPRPIAVLGRPVFYGWWVLLALSALRLVGSGVGNNITSLLVLPLEKEFGATRAEISLMATLSSVATAVSAPLGGWLMDRFGPRGVMFVGLVGSAAGYFLMAGSAQLWQVTLVYTFTIGIAFNWAILNSGAAILNNWFDRGKARALSLLNVGHGGGALLLPLMAFAIATLGWRAALVCGGVALLIVGLPATAVTRDTPEEMGLTPDGDTTPRPAGQRGATSAAWTLREAAGTIYFWAIAAGSACMLIINLSLTFHLVPLMVAKGEPEAVGAGLLSFQVFLSVPIVLACGWLADRVGGNKVQVVLVAASWAGALVLLFAQSMPAYVLAMTLLAFGGSNWAILWAVLGQVYGRKHYNAIRMCIYALLIAGMSTGPLLAGMTFDATHSYDLWLQALQGVGALGVVAFLVTVRTVPARRS